MTKEIIKIEKFIIDAGSIGYRIEASAIPKNLPAKHSIRSQFNDRSIDTPNTHGSLWFYLYALGTDGYAGYAVFSSTGNGIFCDGIDFLAVPGQRDVKNQLYDFAEEFFDSTVMPNTYGADETEAFWANRYLRTFEEPAQKQ